MLHEFIQIIERAKELNDRGISCALVSLVTVNGSSYRKEGVRMLIDENMNSVGAISGGCVEKEIIQRGQAVFDKTEAMVISYDGRYRLGCEGTLYILIELFEPGPDFYAAFETACKTRQEITLQSFFTPQDLNGSFGTIFKIQGQNYPCRNTQFRDYEQVFEQVLKPQFQLILFGAEHDVAKLCHQASLLGWRVIVVCPEKKSAVKKQYPGVSRLVFSNPKLFDYSIIDDNTAVVLMSHNFSHDFRVLCQLKKRDVKYIGVLGSGKRNRQLQDQLFEYIDDLQPDFFDFIYGPAGLDIGAITPEEIAISIIAEILATMRNKNPQPLRHKPGKIHA